MSVLALKPRRAFRSWTLTALILAPLAVAAGWIAYSALAIDHRRKLPPALPGNQFEVDNPSGKVNRYVDGPLEAEPLILVHSVNAAASAYEVRSLYLHYRSRLRIYALDLPGFGLFQRNDRIYTPRAMIDAIHVAVAAIRKRHSDQAVEVIGLSHSYEYLARAAVERLRDYRTLGFVSRIPSVAAAFPKYESA